jgi:hypothetical protein
MNRCAVIQDMEKLIEACFNIYYAGNWTCDRPVDEAKMWADLRDALGIPPGTSPQPIRK